MADRSIGFNIIAKDSASVVLGKVSKSVAGVGTATTNLSKGSSGLSSVRDKFASLAAPAIKFGTDAVDAFKSVATGTMGLRKVMGGSVEDVSRFRGAAQLAGVGGDVLQVSMQKLAKAVGSGSPAFAKMGVNIKDAHGKMLPMKDILPQIEEKFAKMPNGAEKTALAMQLFGKSGSAMIPFLSKGSAGVADLEKKSDKLGLTLRGPALDALTKNNAKMREQQAAIQGAKVQLGAALMPVLAGFATLLSSKVVPAITSVTGFMEKHKNVTIAIGATLAGLIITMKAVTFATSAWSAVTKVASAVTKIWTAIQWAWNAAMDANPIGLIIIVIAAVVAALVIFRGKWSGIWNAVLDAMKAVWKGIKSALDAMVGAFQWVVGMVTKHWKLLASIIFLPIAPLIFLLTHVKQVTAAVSAAFHWVAAEVGKAVGAIGHWIAAAVSFVVGLPGRVLGALGRFEWMIITAAGRALSGFARAVGDGISNVVRFFGGLPDRVLRGLGNIGGMLFGVGRDILLGLWHGLESMGGWIADQVGRLVSNIIPGPIKHILGIHSPSRVTMGLGKFVGQGLAVGMHSSADEVVGASKRLAVAAASGLTGIAAPGARTSPASVAAAAGAGGAVHVHFHGPVYGGRTGLDDLAMDVRSALLRKGVSAGLRIGLA